MKQFQEGILAPVPPLARYLLFSVSEGKHLAASLRNLSKLVNGDHTVVGFDGASFVAVQQWVHDFDALEFMTVRDQDDAIGRRQRDNKELADAPASAHVKRTAQESFSPAAFILRRSMPWANAERAGLMFVAFGNSLDAFDALLRRMVGVDDGIADGLFTFTRPVSGGYFWCPPMKNRRLDLRAIGL